MKYIPRRGDVGWFQFTPQAGHEQAGRCPAVVRSPGSYNAKSGLVLCCPVTSKVKGYPFEVALPAGLGVKGVVLTDQLKSLDWSARNACLIGRLPFEVTEEVLNKALTLLR